MQCSTATKPAPALPGRPPVPVADAKKALRELEGRWEGTFAHALGRYNAVLTIKTGWSGKTEATLDLLELQFREKLTDKLVLKPAKDGWDAVWTSSIAPEASLQGTLALGDERVEGTAAAGRQADLSFVNGASHRIAYRIAGKDLEVAVASAVPGAPPQTLRAVFTRKK
ncbi:MAG: hypothetical protein M0D55_06325 [Elusimicrobiota bacterium]|nr:MAG: hypothetical protein M0D55_06325 [Elusimicrobiota bacterium]